MLQCVAPSCSVSRLCCGCTHCCCSVLLCVAVCCSRTHRRLRTGMLQRGTVWCSVLRCIAVRMQLQGVVAYRIKRQHWGVWQLSTHRCFAVCCSVLQCCSVREYGYIHITCTCTWIQVYAHTCIHICVHTGTSVGFVNADSSDFLVVKDSIYMHTATHSATQTATHTVPHYNTHCTTLQHTLYHTTTHCTTLQHTKGSQAQTSITIRWWTIWCTCTL